MLSCLLQRTKAASFTVEKQHLRLGDSQHYIFMDATKHLSEQLLGPTGDRQNLTVWSSALLLIALCRESFQYLLHLNAQVFSPSMQIQPTGFCFFCLSFAFSVALLKYFWCLWHVDLVVVVVLLVGHDTGAAASSLGCALPLCGGKQVSPRARGANLS